MSRCYACFRPDHDCYCGRVPSVDNRTEILILQHQRERFHPFNTARILHSALRRSRMIVGHPPDLANRPLPIGPEAGVLYPCPTSRNISEVPKHQRPTQLLVVDGTWHHAKTMLRDIPRLNGLTRYRIDPPQPGRYRIRREPTSFSLSSLEATVAVLRLLEPLLEGLDEVEAVFDQMIDRQLNHRESVGRPRQRKPRTRPSRAIPPELKGDLANVVVAYGESTPGGRGVGSAVRRPLVWVAERLGTGERFECMIQPEQTLSEEFLSRLDLDESDFGDAVDPDRFRRMWSDYSCPSDHLIVFHPSTYRLLTSLVPHDDSWSSLKSICFDLGFRFSAMDELSRKIGISQLRSRGPGRAGERLSNAIALTYHLATKHSELSQEIRGLAESAELENRQL